MESASALTWSESCAADCWNSEIEGCKPFDCSGSALAAGTPRTRPLAESASRYLLRRWLAPQPTAPSCPSEPAGFGVEADGAIDSYVHLRMATLASTKHGLHGRNWATRFTYGWMTDLGVYCLSGKVCYRTASA